MDVERNAGNAVDADRAVVIASTARIGAGYVYLSCLRIAVAVGTAGLPCRKAGVGAKHCTRCVDSVRSRSSNDRVIVEIRMHSVRCEKVAILSPIVGKIVWMFVGFCVLFCGAVLCQLG